MKTWSFMIFVFHLYSAEAFGIWVDANHYKYMVLFGCLGQLRQFGICNDELFFPAKNPILFRALPCYLQKIMLSKLCALVQLSCTMVCCHCCFAYYVDHISVPMMLKIIFSPLNDGM
jgi:hypothetical protein